MSKVDLRAGTSIIIHPINEQIKTLMQAHTFIPPTGPPALTPWDRIPSENWFTGGEENLSDLQFPNVSIYLPNVEKYWAAISKRKAWDGKWHVQFGFQDFTQSDMLIGYEFIEQLDKMLIEHNRLFPHGAMPDEFKVWEAIYERSSLDYDEDFLFAFIICELNIKIQRCDI